jgi:hypothetical protein
MYKEDWWVVDAGILMYREEKPPRDVRQGCRVSGEIYLGIDPFFYFERLSREYDAPALIYDWEIRRIEVQTGSLIEHSSGAMVSDPKQSGQDVADTAARGGDYVLHCRVTLAIGKLSERHHQINKMAIPRFRVWRVSTTTVVREFEFTSRRPQ